MSKKIDGGFAIVKTLKKLGIKDIFTLAGGHINPVSYTHLRAHET